MEYFHMLCSLLKKVAIPVSSACDQINPAFLFSEGLLISPTLYSIIWHFLNAFFHHHTKSSLRTGPWMVFTSFYLAARQMLVIIKKKLTYVYFIIIFFFRAIPTACGGSQARGRIRATASGLHHRHSNVGSKLSLWPTPQLMAMLDPWPTEQGRGSNPHPHG